MTEVKFSAPCVYINGKTRKKGTFKILSDGHNDTMNFYSEAPIDLTTGIPNLDLVDIPDFAQLFRDFKALELLMSDKMLAQFDGLKGSRLFEFSTYGDVEGLLIYMSINTKIRVTDKSSFFFKIEAPDSRPTIFTPFIPTKDPVTGGKIYSMARIEKENLGFTNSFQDETLSEEQYNGMFEDGKPRLEYKEHIKTFYNKIIDDTIIDKVLFDLLFPELFEVSQEEKNQKKSKLKESYNNYKLQWETITPKQWINNTDIREYMILIEKDIIENEKIFQSFSEPEAQMKRAFDISATLTIFNYDKCRYTKGLVSFMIPFLEAFNEDYIAFWAFYRFYDRNRLKDVLLPTQAPLVREICVSVDQKLHRLFPDLLQLALQRHADNLLFLAVGAPRWFVGSLPPAASRRLMVSGHSAASNDFLAWFCVAALYTLAPAIAAAETADQMSFIRTFNELMAKADIGLILRNTASLIESEDAKML